ncbi:MAG: hypothetical protein C0501_23315 [Isosphaera sp.]|nr:hypothetical protein [Isosphaera sp.]
MAYNPFNIFRRNQKTIFAVITVFIMFTFVLSSGLGGGADFFDWLPKWLGSSRAKGDALATLDGSPIYEKDLTGDRNSLRLQRVMANRFMFMAADQAVRVLDERVSAQAPRMAPEAQRMMQPIREQQMFVQQIARQIRDPRVLAEFARQAEAEMRSGLYAMVNAPSLRSEDKEVARAMLAAMAIQQSMGGQEHYFGNAPNRGLRDLIEFMLWQKKADQLGIRFTTDDVKKLIRSEFYEALQSDVQIQKALRENMPGFTMDACLRAIGEEFRVRAAQAAVLGPAFAHRDRGGVDKTYSGSPVFSAPYEALEFFREQVSPTTYAVVPVPAANFVEQVPDPDESNPKVRDELLALYDQYKAREPDPSKETPGFRTPRRVSVGWLAVKGDSPYYLALAEAALKQSEPVAKLGLPLAVPVGPWSPAEVAAAVAPLGATDTLLEAAYQRVVEDRHASDLRQRWKREGSFDGEPFGYLLDTSVVRPGVLAATAGGAAAELAGFGSPFAAAATAAAGAASGYEVRDRLRAGFPLVLGAVPGPATFETLMAGEAAHRAVTPQPLPLAVHRPTLMKDLVAENARRLAAEDIRTFARETRRWSSDRSRDKWWAQQYIKQFAAKRGLTIHTSTEPRSEWALEEDPALAELVKAQREMLKAASGPHGSAGQERYRPFGDRFFYQFTPGGRAPATGTYVASPYPGDAPPSEFDLLRDKPHYLVWRTDEKPSAPRSYGEAKADVVLAWKRQKARELARAKAEQLAEAVRKGDGGASEPVLVQNLEDAAARLRAEFKDPKAQARVEPFLIRGVAPLSTVPDPAAGRGLFEFLIPTPRGAVQPFALPASENLRYPTPDMEKALIADRTKERKHVAVLADAPKDTFYVTVLLKREEKTEFDYRSEVAGEGGRRLGGSVVLEAFRGQARDKAVRSVLGLLKQEFKYAETEEQKKKLDENDRRGGDA